MYSAAAMRVQDFLNTRRLARGAILSAATTIESSGVRRASASVAPFSFVFLRRLLTAHGYTESLTSAPKTFHLIPGLSDLRITRLDASEYLISDLGVINALAANGVKTAARQLDLEPVPLGNYQSSQERVGLAVPLAAFSPHILKAVIAVEDDRFYRHFGIDPLGIARAALVNLSAGSWVQGGSTLTQQMAKNLFLTSDRSLVRKVKELFISLALERTLSKEQLLELYLNEVYLGSEAGNPIRGVPAAARWLFNKSPGALTISESALLAGMIQAPSINNPRTRQANAEARRRVALQRMMTTSAISNAEWKLALADKPLIYSTQNLSGSVIPSAGLAPYVAAAASQSELDSGNAQVQTTISPLLQRCAEQAVSTGAMQMSRRLKRRLKAGSAQANSPQIGLVAIDVGKNRTVALVGGTNFAINKINHATGLKRQLGSTVKPFVYLRAFENGVTLTSRLEDEPLSAGKWKPENFDHTFRGVVTARYALENSLNLPTIRLANSVGLAKIAATFTDFKIVDQIPQAYPALAIGAIEGTLFDLTNAYAALARGGEFKSAALFVDQSQVEKQKTSANVADPRAVFLVTNALQGVIQRGTARGLNAADFSSIAGKTGTSDSTRDAWFVGYTPALAFGVWVGFDDNRALGMTGGAAAAPIAGDFLRCSAELIPKLKFLIPPGIELRAIDPGKAEESSDGDGTVKEFFINNETRAPDLSAQPAKNSADSSAEPKSSATMSWLERFGL